MSIITNHNKRDLPNAVWTIKDVLIVTFCVLIGGILSYIAGLAFLGDNKATLRIARYVGSLLMIFFPLFWIKKKFGLKREALGLRKGIFSLSPYILLGIGTAVIYVLIIHFTPLGDGTYFTGIKMSYSYLDLILLPLSISGFASIVLTPVGEEILVRGFMYGYFRKRLGVAIGLILQAMVFALLHFSPSIQSIQVFIIGVILGLLYEQTGSIYSSIICHGATNFIAIIFKLAA